MRAFGIREVDIKLGRVDEQEKKDYNIPPEPTYGGRKCQFDCC